MVKVIVLILFLFYKSVCLFLSNHVLIDKGVRERGDIISFRIKPYKHNKIIK